MASLNDTSNLFSKLNWSRTFNAGSVLLSYYWSRLIKKPRPLGLPIAMAIEPTTSCNLRCPQCPSGLRSFSRPTGMLHEDEFRKIIDETQRHLLYLTFYFQGEPYLNPKFLDMVRYASSKNIYTTTSTNAHFLKDDVARKTVESGLDRIIISIDGTTQESYQAYRIGGQLEKVIEGTERLIYWKKKLRSRTPHVIFQFIVFRQNEHEISEIRKLAKRIGVNELKLKTAQVYDFANSDDLLPSDHKYARYEEAAGIMRIRNKFLNHCWRLWHACVITWDGSVVPCCFDKDAKHSMGNLRDKSLKDIWYGPAYDAFRRSLFKSRKEIDICSNCSEGTKVWA